MSHYYHPPGELSRTAILDIGLRCTHSCKFCYYSFLDNGADQFHGMRHAAFRDSHGLLQLVTNLRRNEFLGFDVTGGEPTLHPAIVRLIEHGTNLGLYSRIITLGQFLLRSMRGATRPLLEELLEAGLTNLLFSFHSSDDNEFNALTGASLSKQLAAMDYLAKRDFQFTTNTVVIAENARRIPEIAKRLVQTNTYLHNFIMMNPYYEWNNGGRAFGILPRYTELLPSLNEAVAILADANIACNIRYAPLCGLPGLEKHIVGVAGVRYDPYEWMNRESHRGEVDPVQAAAPWQIERGSVQAEFCLYRVTGPGKADPSVFAVRGPSSSSVLAAICQNCTLLPACDGVNPKYLENFGSGELCPYDDRGVSGVLTNVRRSYVPAFLVKTASDTDMRRIYRRFLSPSPSADKPRVSVVITTYNNGSTVVRALKAALDQVYPYLEIIVLDDGSDDDTVARLEASGLLDDPRVRLLRQANSGQPALARNSGMSASTGEMILPLDADDWIAPTYIAEAVSVLAQNPSISIVYSDAQYSRKGLVKAQDYDFANLIYRNQLSYCSVFKREVFDDVGGYRSNVRGVEDWDFWVAAGSLGHFGKRIPHPLFHYTESDHGVFAQEVAGNLESKFAQIVLNNPRVYQPGHILWARQRLQTVSKPPLVVA